MEVNADFWDPKNKREKIDVERDGVENREWVWKGDHSYTPLWKNHKHLSKTSKPLRLSDDIDDIRDLVGDGV